MGKKNRKKFNHLSDPETYTYSEFKSINGSVTRKYIYNKGLRSDAFGRTSEKELWSNPYTAWTKYNTSGYLPHGLKPSSYQTIRNYNSISYNSLKDAGNVNIQKSNRKRVIPKNTISSGELLNNNLKVEKSIYNNYLRNLNIANRNLKRENNIQNSLVLNKYKTIRVDNVLTYTSFSPSFYYSSPTKYNRDYFGSTLLKNNKSNSLTIADLEKKVTSQYWEKKSKLTDSQGKGIKVYNGKLPENITIDQWYKNYPKLPFNYYNYSFL